MGSGLWTWNKLNIYFKWNLQKVAYDIQYQWWQFIILIIGGTTGKLQYSFVDPAASPFIFDMTLFLICLFIQRSVQLQSDRYFSLQCIHTNKSYHIQVHKSTWQRVLARKRVRRPVEEWLEAHFEWAATSGIICFSDLVFPAHTRNCFLLVSIESLFRSFNLRGFTRL